MVGIVCCGKKTENETKMVTLFQKFGATQVCNGPVGHPRFYGAKKILYPNKNTNVEPT